MLACLCPGSFLFLRILPLSSVSKYSCYFAKKKKEKRVSTPSYTKYELMNRIGSECSGQCPPSYEAELERLYRRAQTKRFSRADAAHMHAFMSIVGADRACAYDVQPASQQLSFLLAGVTCKHADDVQRSWSSGGRQACMVHVCQDRSIAPVIISRITSYLLQVLASQ
jgi:hypothetical protein